MIRLALLPVVALVLCSCIAPEPEPAPLPPTREVPVYHTRTRTRTVYVVPTRRAPAENAESFRAVERPSTYSQ